MIRIYGGTVTAGVQDGVEVGTEENPILFDGLYPATTGSAQKSLTFAIRTDGEIEKDLLISANIIDSNSQEGKRFFRQGIGKEINDSCNKIYIAELRDKNVLFTLNATAYGSEETTISPDLRTKLYIMRMRSMLQPV